MQQKNQNQKEKFEVDLKKEIKRLQRYRDSVKTWASQDAIKQKPPLIEARKEIETRMERVWRFFQSKRSERQGLQSGEMKLKSYSKEGLGKRHLEPLTAQQEVAIGWIDKQEEALKCQLDDLIEQQERLTGSSRKKKKNRERDDEELALEKRVEQHEFHIKKMKMLKEVVINRKIKPSLIDSIKEEVEYYVTDAIQDPQFMDDEYLYETIQDAIENENKEEPVEAEESPTPPMPEKKLEKRPSKKSRKKEKKLKPVKLVTQNDKKRTPFGSPPSSSSAQTGNKSRTLAMDTDKISDNIISFAGSKKPVVSPVPIADHNTPSSTANLRQILKDQIKSSNAKIQPPVPSFTESLEPARSVAASVTSDSLKVMRTPPAQAEISHRDVLPSLTLTQQIQSDQVSKSTVKKVPALADIIKDELAKTQNFNVPSCSQPKSGSESSHSKPPTPYMNLRSSREAPVEQSAHMKHSSNPVLSQLDTVLHKSYQNMIQPSDTCQERAYLPRNPYQTPRFFPEHPDTMLFEPSVFEKFDTDTLFFIFYFQQRTYQQYLAACELKKGAWRYHKKYLTWFQRHSEPEETTEEYEKGTYVYFDYDTSWCPRMKAQFVFEYSYLEDELDYAKDKIPVER